MADGTRRESENECSVAREGAGDCSERRCRRGAGGGGVTSSPPRDHKPCTRSRECRDGWVVPARSPSTDGVDPLKVEAAQVGKRCNVVPALLVARHHPCRGKSCLARPVPLSSASTCKQCRSSREERRQLCEPRRRPRRHPWQQPPARAKQPIELVGTSPSTVARLLESRRTDGHFLLARVFSSLVTAGGS